MIVPEAMVEPRPEISAATDEDRRALESLGRLCTYGISEYAHSQSDFYHCQSDGTFQDSCKFYYDQERFLFFLVKVDEELGGFAIVEVLSHDPVSDFSISEFYITRPRRGRGVGTFAAHSLFDLHPGRWDVCVWLGNRSAFAFWDRAIDRYTNGNYVTAFGVPNRSSVEYEGWRSCTHTFTSRSTESRV